MKRLANGFLNRFVEVVQAQPIRAIEVDHLVAVLLMPVVDRVT